MQFTFSMAGDETHKDKRILFIIWCFFIGMSLARENIEDIAIEKAPFKVLITESTNHSKVVGSGAILNEEWVVTTASSLKGHWNRPLSLMVRSGSGLFNKNGSLHNVKKIIVHPNFDRSQPFFSTEGDIALIQVAFKFHLSMTVAPVYLAPQLTPHNTTAHLVTWPLKALDGLRSPTLKAVATVTQDWINCTNTFSSKTAVTLGIRTVCTDTLSLKGDNGDPLISDTRLIGLYKSFPVKDDGSLPQVYIRVTSYRNWIRQNLRTTSADNAGKRV